MAQAVKSDDVVKMESKGQTCRIKGELDSCFFCTTPQTLMNAEEEKMHVLENVLFTFLKSFI